MMDGQMTKEEDDAPWCVGESVAHHACPMYWGDVHRTGQGFAKMWLCPFCNETTLGLVATQMRLK